MEINTVALIGLGAIGSYIAAGISEALGDNLRIIADGERAERIKADGAIVNGKKYMFNVVSPDEKTGPADLVIVITKMTGIEKALEDVRNQVGDNTVIMSPLNGVESEEAVANAYGWDKVIYSLARISSVRDGNSVSFNPANSFLEYGEKTNKELSDRVKAIRKLFTKSGIRSVNPQDMVKAIWEKFVCNVSENQVAAILGIPFGAWGGSEHANTLRLMAAAEVIAIARKKGIMIDEDYAALHIERLNNLPKGNKASTLQDIENGRKTEVEMFAGTVIRLGKEASVPTPVNEFMYHAIKVLEEKQDRDFSK